MLPADDKKCHCKHNFKLFWPKDTSLNNLSEFALTVKYRLGSRHVGLALFLDYEQNFASRIYQFTMKFYEPLQKKGIKRERK